MKVGTVPELNMYHVCIYYVQYVKLHVLLYPVYMVPTHIIYIYMTVGGEESIIYMGIYAQYVLLYAYVCCTDT